MEEQEVLVEEIGECTFNKATAPACFLEELSLFSMDAAYGEEIATRECSMLTAYLYCKGCHPYGQLLCGMLQVPGAVQTLHTHSMAAHGRNTGAYNTPVTTQ